MRCEQCHRELSKEEDLSVLPGRGLCGKCLKTMNAGAIGYFLRPLDADMHGFIASYNLLMERREKLRRER